MRVALLTTDSREHYKDYQNPAPYFGAAPEALLEGFMEMTDVEVHVLSCLQEPVPCPERIGANIWYHGLHVPKTGWLRTGYQGCVRAVRKRLKKIRPDIVHGQGTERDCAFCAVLSGFPNVITIHGNIARLAHLFGARFGSYAWFSAKLENFALRRTAGVFCNSAHTEKLVRSRTPRTWRVPNPVRGRFLSDIAPRVKREKPVLLNVGVITPNKRPLDVLRLARKLHDQGLPVEFRFMGHAPEHDAYAAAFLKEISTAQTMGYASFLGLLKVEELIRCFDESDGLVHFPIEESFGLVVAEALARNLRVFGSSTGGIADITESVPGAALYDVNDWEGLRQGLQIWLKAGCPTTASAPIMRDRYSPEVVARRHLEIYREVLSGCS